MECKKCEGPGTIVLRKKDSYCDNCFIANTNHKFRSCIGKNKILSSNEPVLICLSGGGGSAVMLDFIHNGISLDSHKKLRIIPIFLHVTGPEGGDSHAIDVVEQCQKYKFDVYVVHISDYYNEHVERPEVNCLPSINKSQEIHFNKLLKSVPATSRNDLLLKIKHHLFIKFAKLLKCNYIFTAETTTTLAINLLSNLALGRGSQVQNDIGFCDARNENIKILRPMKDITKEELDHYIAIKQLSSVQCNALEENSLQSVIQAFVTDLQESFPATISTVCKTADKIGVHDQIEKEEFCIICKSDLGKTTVKLSALEATNISRIVSNGRPRPLNQNTTALSDVSYIDAIQESQDTNNPIFPFVHMKLCYGCSRNYSEMDKSNLPNHLKNFL